MASLIDQAIDVARDAVKTAACNARYLTDNLPAFGPLAEKQREISRGVWAALCPLPVPPSLGEPTPGPPAGGQCLGVEYAVGVTVSPVNYATFTGCVQGAADATYTQYFRGFGPFNLVRTTTSGPEGCPLVGYSLTTNGGSNTLSITTNRHPATVATITSYDRYDGLPDNCGDPTEPVPPPDPGPPLPPFPPVDRPVTPPGGGPDVDITFSPKLGPVFVGVGGVAYIPVTVEIGGPEVDIDVPVTIPVNISLPDLNVNVVIGGGSGGGNQPGPPSQVCCTPPVIPGDDVVGTDEQPVEAPPPEKGLQLVGVRVLSFVNNSRCQATELLNPEPLPNLFVPRIGSVHFQLKALRDEDAEATTYSIDYDVKMKDQFIPAPPDVTVLGAFVVPSQGVNMTLTPLYKQAN